MFLDCLWSQSPSPILIFLHMILLFLLSFYRFSIKRAPLIKVIACRPAGFQQRTVIQHGAGPKAVDGASLFNKLSEAACIEWADAAFLCACLLIMSGKFSRKLPFLRAMITACELECEWLLTSCSSLLCLSVWAKKNAPDECLKADLHHNNLFFFVGGSLFFKCSVSASCFLR